MSVPIEKKLALIKQIREQSDSNLQAMSVRSQILGGMSGGYYEQPDEVCEKSTFSFRLLIAGIIFILYICSDFLVQTPLGSYIIQIKTYVDSQLGLNIFDFISQITYTLHSIV